MILKGKRAWVTGASGTIGGAVAECFKDEGAELFTERIDVSNYDLVNRTASVFKPNILVNCAGIYGPHSPVERALIQHWEQTISINLIGSFYLTRACLPYMEQYGGKIIHLSGGGAAYGRPYYSAYAASKTALVRFVECVAGEVDKIQINAVAPGSVKSKMNPTGTETPEKAVELILYLASKESNHVTGRLISAQHDNWRTPFQFSDDFGKLRRVPL